MSAIHEAGRKSGGEDGGGGGRNEEMGWGGLYQNTLYTCMKFSMKRDLAIGNQVRTVPSAQCLRLSSRRKERSLKLKGPRRSWLKTLMGCAGW